MPRTRWIEDDLRKMEIRKWRRLCNERAEWRNVIEEAKTNSGL